MDENKISPAADSMPQTQPDRQAQPVDTEQPPRLPFPVVGIGASAGGLESVTEFLSTVRPDSGIAFVFVQHLPPTGESMLVEILKKRADLPVLHVDDQMPVKPDHFYVIRPGHTLIIKDGRFHLGERLQRPMHNRPVDDFFKSLAEEQRERAIAVVMSGMGSNGAAGAQAIKAVGGLCIAQDPDTTQYPSMPRHLIDAGYADYILKPRDMFGVIREYTSQPYASGQREEPAKLIRRDQQHFREILAILRSRTRQDFNGYKKPTLLRRIQRRMGLNRISKLSEYARLLRQTPTEVTNLADDLLIHVTGFFRDTAAWDALRNRVVIPLIASRHNNDAVRCWVTACSSGEEAYSLAMLLVEEAERAGKMLDLKVFATDVAERNLANARAGTYPGGIEAEVSADRLERFFTKEDALYRVRPELRERVVFAPQNVLQDPPFSRLDIISCRNLLIYLEPQVQTRILALLHFGLREGGALFLGTSETVNIDGLFEPIDKSARIYRRVGPTRPSSTDFSMPRALQAGNNPRETNVAPARVSAPRPSMAQMIKRALLENHMPAAVTIDREGKIAFYHGHTEPFIGSPRGEPTRDLLELTRESVRGATRTAIHRAMTSNASVTVMDGIIEVEPHRRMRIAVTASPLDPRNAPGYLVVSFQERGEAIEHQSVKANEIETEELRRVREELQNTIEELQTSNEELKASHEEVISTNEELQSTNEELETGREEMQSLNEELNTANIQLRAKIDEQQAASNDLTSLLTSTDIAVLFLDRQFHIRRYTDALCDLVDLIQTDVGRSINDLTKKFSDPDLMREAGQVLVSLVPAAREIKADNGRTYLRRITPYRTADNHIDGVVVTFIDISNRKQAEDRLKASEEQLRLIIEGARNFAIIMLDAAGKINLWNVGAERLFGYTEAEAVGQSSQIIFTPEDQNAGAMRRELNDAQTSGQVVDERWYVRKDGTRLWGSGALSALDNPTGGPPRGFVKIMRDETDRKAAQEGLVAAKQAAERANHAKDKFLATLSHELRTPLSSILIWSNLFHDRQGAPEEYTEALEAITRSAESQKQLIDDLLDTARITSGKLRLELRPTNLSMVVQAAVDAVMPAAQAKDLTIVADCGNRAGIVQADPDRLRQVIWNLLNNAIKFTPSGGRIDVTLRRTGKEIEILVADNGKGIDAATLPHVFEPFWQAEAVSTRTHGGLGLGLAICKQLVEQHGGTIAAASAGAGKGATFTIHLPLPAVQSQSARRATPSNADSQSAAAALKGKQILLVEDNPDTRAALVRLLDSAGGKVTAVESVAAAKKALKKDALDVLISDIGMPGEDGYGLIRHLRESEAGKKRLTAVALTAFARPEERDKVTDTDAGRSVLPLTAFARPEERDKALQAGFDQHVAKPVDPAKLLSLLQQLLSERQGV